MTEKVMLWVLMMVMIFGASSMDSSSNNNVYKVGGSSGWTTSGGPNLYKYWSASHTFHVGDTLLFEYNKEFHDVVRVTHKNFNTCNSTAPYGSWATGNDSFTINKPGHYYFICSVPGHCPSGQKLDIRVVKDHKHGPSPSPMLSPPGPSPRSPSAPTQYPDSPTDLSPAPTPVPRHKSGCYSLHSSCKLLFGVVAIGLSSLAY